MEKNTWATTDRFDNFTFQVVSSPEWKDAGNQGNDERRHRQQQSNNLHTRISHFKVFPLSLKLK